MTWILPLIVFSLHTLLLAGCLAMVMRSPNNDLANVYFLPVMLVDLPVSMAIMAFDPLLTAMADWLAPVTGKGEATALSWAAWLGLIGPLHWLALACWIGSVIDRRRARRYVAYAEFAAAAPVTSVAAGGRRAA